MTIQGTETRKNLEAAFAGEAMAFRRYLYFGEIARELGSEEVAEVFEKTARDEFGHAVAHLQLLYPKYLLTVEKLLEIAAEGELYETNIMYPQFEATALREGNLDAVEEFREQQKESLEHAEIFKAAAKRFKSFKKVEKAHADHYLQTLEKYRKEKAAEVTV
ncbi:MAG: rubrerythrin family protein [Chloroherpetonaceae bacterium]|nr:rubrerythrin family protein [Chloroherpetonaceae bacterium]